MTSPHHPAADRPFKKGDRVRSNHHEDIDEGWRGRTGTVLGTSSFLRGAFYVQFDNTGSDDPRLNGGSWLPEMLELTTPPASASEKWEPKIGDFCEGRTWDGSQFGDDVLVRGVLSEPIRQIQGESEKRAVLKIDDRYASVRGSTLRPAASAQRIESEPECAACGSKMDREYRRNFPPFEGAPLCSGCGNRKTVENDRDIIARGGWPRQSPRTEQPPAPPATAKGDPIRRFCDDCGTALTARANHWVCADCEEHERQAEVWGIPAATVETPAPKRSDRYGRNRCNEPGCDCPYCRHRAWSPKLGANDPRYPASTLDATIASLESDGKARVVAARHASDWDVDDAPENYSTTSSRGGQ